MHDLDDLDVLGWVPRWQ